MLRDFGGRTKKEEERVQQKVMTNCRKNPISQKKKGEGNRRGNSRMSKGKIGLSQDPQEPKKGGRKQDMGGSFSCGIGKILLKEKNRY